ncbi:MAG: PKD domain-containing protein, partial [Verrucomicrobiales bacterium]|nr:PKD domain-containing protein [Verrucomicrobiales bacterium]
MALPLPAQQDLTLSGTAPAGSHTYQAINSITAASYTISSGSNITFEAGNVIRLQNGFRAAAGSQFYAAITPLVVAPALTSPAPSTGGNAWTPQSFTFTFTDSRGFSDISSFQVSFGGTNPTQGICSLQYAGAALGLWNNTGSALLTSPLQNSQCGINSWHVTGAGTNTLTFTVSITFYTSFAGVREIYALGVSASSSFAPWADLGSWNVIAVAPYFNFEIYPSAYQTISVNGLRSYDATITPVNGFQGTVALVAVLVWPLPSVQAFPPLSPVLVTGPTQVRVQLWLQGTTGVPAGSAVYSATANGLTQFAAANFAVQAGAPPPPAPVTLSSPASGASVTTTPTLSWSPSSGATGYDVFLGQSGLASQVASVAGQTTYSVPPALSSGISYDWFVYAKNSAGASPMSAVRSFVTSGGSGGSPTVSCSVSPSSPLVGQQVTVSATPSGGSAPYTYAWSGAVSGTGQSASFTPTSAGTYTGSVTVTDSASHQASASCPVAVSQPGTPQPLVLPTSLKGINYFPRGHAWYRMLYDWESYDCDSSSLLPTCVPNTKVKDIVAADLQQLKGKVSFIHLYLWDQDILSDSLVGEYVDAPGFRGWDNGGPESSPRSQWNALKAFVQLAKANDMWVHLEFAVGRPNRLVNARCDVAKTEDCHTPAIGATAGSEYAGWVKKFYDHVKEHQNVLIWGLDYGVLKPNFDTGQAFWNAAYPSVLAHIRANPYSSPSGRALLSVESYFGMDPGDDPPPILDGHRWSWEDSQRMAWFWKQVSPDAPDLYAFQMWHAHVGDLEANLECVAGTINAAFCSSSATCGPQCSPIPFSKMVVTEYGTGTSFEGPPIGNRTAGFGDAFTPTFNLAGQQSWLDSILCLFARRGIAAHAYFGLYDSASFWERDYDFTGAALAWHGYWGWSSELQSYGDKPSWSTFFTFNPGACPASNVPATPVLA